MTADGPEHQSEAPNQVELGELRPGEGRPRVLKPCDPSALPADIGEPGRDTPSASELEHEDDEYEEL